MKSFTLTSLLALAVMAPCALSVPIEETDAITFVAVEEPIHSTLVARQGETDSFFQAFSGANCDGDAAPEEMFNVFNSPRCTDTRDRHSFRIRGNCKDLIAVASSGDSRCGSGDGGAQKIENGCYSVNTGSNWQGMIVYCRDPQP